MILTTILLSVLFALLFASLLTYGFRRRGPGPARGMVFLFLIIFMFTWAIGSWLEPIGPVHWGVTWLGYFLVAFLIMLLIGALLPQVKSQSQVITKSELDKEVREDKRTGSMELTFGFIFWLMILSLFILAMIRIAQ